MIKALLSFILLSTVFACNNQTKNTIHSKDITTALNPEPVKDSTILIVKLKPGESVSFFFADEFNDTEAPFFLTATDSIKKLDLHFPTLLIDSYHHVPYLIYPGERLTVSLSKSKTPRLFIEGNEIRNNELNFCVEQVKEKDFIFQQNMMP